MTSFSLPPVLSSSPAYDHKGATFDLPCIDSDILSEDETPQVELGRVTTPAETPIFICALESCNRLFPSRDRLAQHRKVAHPGTDAHTDVLTWNEDPAPPTA